MTSEVPVIITATRTPEDPAFNGTNDHRPTVMLNEPTVFNISNAPGNLMVINISVSDDDVPPNGSHIRNASVYLGAFGVAPVYADMEYWPTIYDDVTRKTGRWVCNWTLPVWIAPGVYTVKVNVSDSGNISAPGSSGLSTEIEFYMTFYQENRAPTAPYPGSHNIMEDDRTTTFDLDDIFNDPDIDTPPAHTDPDSYTFFVWDGTDFVTQHDFGHYRVTIDTEARTALILPDSDWYNVESFLAAGDTVTFRAEDSHGKGVNNTVEFKVKSVNDPPVLMPSGIWKTNKNVTHTPFGFSGYEDTQWRIEISARDNDTANPIPDVLIYDMEYTGTDLDLPVKMYPQENGIFDFTPANDDVGTWKLNISVFDAEGETDHMQVQFEVINTNDPPIIKKVWVGDRFVNVVDHRADLKGPMGAIEEQLFEFTLEAEDEDESDSIKFDLAYPQPWLQVAESGWGSDKWNFSFYPMNDDAVRGYVQAVIIVKDRIEPDRSDMVTINISVRNVNDPPEIILVDDGHPPRDKSINRGIILYGEFDNFTVIAFDIDYDELSLKSDLTDVSVSYLGKSEWQVSFNPSETQRDQNVSATLTVTDGTESDQVILEWYVVGDPFIWPPNEPPSIMINTPNWNKYVAGDLIEIEGTYSDPDQGDNVEIRVEMVMPGEIRTGVFQFIPDARGIDNVWIEYGDGTWKYTYDTENLEALKDLARLLGIDLEIYGTYTFYFIAVDDFGWESQVDSVMVIVEEEPNEKPYEEPLSMGLFAYDVVALFFIALIMIIIFLVLVFKRPKKKARAEVKEEREQEPRTVRCRNCGSTIDQEYEICLWCGSDNTAEVATLCGCGRPLYEGMARCPDCGTPRSAGTDETSPSTWTACRNCGIDMPPNSVYCEMCGTPFAEPAPADAHIPPPPPSSRAVEVEYERDLRPEDQVVWEGDLLRPEEEPEGPKQKKFDFSRLSKEISVDTVECPVCGEYFEEGTEKCGACGAPIYS